MITLSYLTLTWSLSYLILNGTTVSYLTFDGTDLSYLDSEGTIRGVGYIVMNFRKSTFGGVSCYKRCDLCSIGVKSLFYHQNTLLDAFRTNSRTIIGTNPSMVIPYSQSRFDAYPDLCSRHLMNSNQQQTLCRNVAIMAICQVLPEP